MYGCTFHARNDPISSVLSVQPSHSLKQKKKNQKICSEHKLTMLGSINPLISRSSSSLEYRKNRLSLLSTPKWPVSPPLALSLRPLRRLRPPGQRPLWKISIYSFESRATSRGSTASTVVPSTPSSRRLMPSVLSELMDC